MKLTVYRTMVSVGVGSEGSKHRPGVVGRLAVMSGLYQEKKASLEQ